MTKYLHRTALGNGRRFRPPVQVGEPDYGELVDRILDKGVVINAADRLGLVDNHDGIALRARKECA